MAAGTVSVDITVVTDGVSSGYLFPNVDADSARKVADHLLSHALQKINMMMPDDPATVIGTRSITATYSTMRDSDGAPLGSQVNSWPTLDDAAVGALHGALDAAIASLTEHLGAKGKKK